MSKDIFDTLSDEAQTRRNNELISQQNMMANLYKGQLPQEYEKYFPKNAPRTVVQLIKNAHRIKLLQLSRGNQPQSLRTSLAGIFRVATVEDIRCSNTPERL